MKNPQWFNSHLMNYDRAALGWSQQTLADKAGVSQGAVSQFLLNRRQAPQMASKLAKALGQDLKRYLVEAK